MKQEYQGNHLELTNVSESSPCLHCGKPDYCYVLSNGLSVCNRDIEPASGWYKTSKQDDRGHYFYAPKQKVTTKKQRKQYYYPNRNGDRFIRVTRIDNGDGTKKVFQSSWQNGKWVNSLKGIDRKDIPVYRYQEIKEAIAKKEQIFVVEGEKCADLLWTMGLPATTNIGGGKKWQSSDSKDLEGARIVLCPDRDHPGIAHMLRISEDFPNAEWLYAPPNDFFWQTRNLRDSQGLDIYDWVKGEGATKNDILDTITHRAPSNLHKNVAETVVIEEDNNLEAQFKLTALPDVEEMMTQKAVDALFRDTRYIALDEQLYEWTGTHYHPCSVAKQRRKIVNWCNTTPVQVSRDRWKYAYATPTAISSIEKYVLQIFAVDREELNQGGINCLNGVLEIKWQGNKPKWELLPHDPEKMFTYVSQVEYDPFADDTDCNRLLSCLNPEQQLIFLRTVAASLDLNKVRSRHSRDIKALLCQGTGRNGKDTLREATKIIFGTSMSNASLADFKNYDDNTKYGVAKIEGAKINWSSENGKFTVLDGLQGLKAAITGDPISIENKYEKEKMVEPQTVFFFNVNDAPLIPGGAEAISSRWSILNFSKTYVKNADPTKGELEEDPRFRYDPDFLEKNVCPALLNKILEQLKLVMTEGINHKANDDELAKIQRESNHLWDFAQDVGLVFEPGGRVYIKDLWERLKDWYIETGTLEIWGDRQIWHDQPRASDKNIKAVNQIYKRFKELFPKIDKHRHTERFDLERMGQFYLSGLTLQNWNWSNARIHSYQSSEDAEAKNYSLENFKRQWENINQKTKLEIMSFLKDKEAGEKRSKEIASASSAAHYTKDTASAVASAVASARPNESNNTNGNSQGENVSPPMTFVVNNHAKNEVSVSDIHNLDHAENTTITTSPPIEWVKTKDGKILNIEYQEGLKLWGRESGIRKKETVFLDQCQEIHYKKIEREFIGNKLRKSEKSQEENQIVSNS